MDNYIKIQKKSLLYNFFMYIDKMDVLANRIFAKNGFKPKYLYEYRHKEYDYIIVVCRVRKKDNKIFLKSMEELKKNMLLTGNTGYEEFCKKHLPKGE